MAQPNIAYQLSERRAAPRALLGRVGTISLTTDATSREVIVRDLTRDGCRIETAEEYRPGEVVMIGIANVGRVSARLVRRDASGYGCAFERPLARGLVTAAFTPSNVAAFPVQERDAAPAAPAAQPAAPNLLVTAVTVGAISVVGWAAVALLAIRFL